MPPCLFYIVPCRAPPVVALSGVIPREGVGPATRGRSFPLFLTSVTHSSGFSPATLLFNRTGLFSSSQPNVQPGTWVKNPLEGFVFWLETGQNPGRNFIQRYRASIQGKFGDLNSALIRDLIRSFMSVLVLPDMVYVYKEVSNASHMIGIEHDQYAK